MTRITVTTQKTTEIFIGPSIYITNSIPGFTSIVSSNYECHIPTSDIKKIKIIIKKQNKGHATNINISPSTTTIGDIKWSSIYDSSTYTTTNSQIQ